MKPKPAVVKAKKPTRAYRDSESTVGYAGITKDIEMDSDSDQNEDEITLADRVTALDTKPKRQTPKKKTVAAPVVPATGTLSTVLTQALNTSDQALLESCFAYTDPGVIRQTLLRLDPPLSAILLDGLAERIARTPTRSSQLAVWIRTVLVVHAGYLVGLPGLANTLTTVRSTLARNAGTLPRLLALKGRLDMLGEHIELRREVKEQDLEDVDSDVEYVEGAEDEIVLDDAGYIVGEDDEDEDEEEEDEDEDEEDEEDEDEDEEDENEEEDDGNPFVDEEAEEDEDEDDRSE